MAQLGKPYVWGDEGPDTFDCSGLMQYAYELAGVQLPRTARQQQAWAQPVTSPRPGDLVFFGRPATHVGMYLGAGKMINSPGKGQRVKVSGVGSPTSYGRVPGVGAAVAPVAGIVSGAASTVGDAVAGMVGAVRAMAMEAAFAALGLALLGVGVYRAIVGRR